MKITQNVSQKHYYAIMLVHDNRQL